MKYTATNRHVAFSFETRDSRVVSASAGMEWAVGKHYAAVAKWCNDRHMVINCVVGQHAHIMPAV